MLMKVFNKGQIVIPSAIRSKLGISIGDMLDCNLNNEEQVLKISKPNYIANKIGGSLHKYAIDKPFPNKTEIRNALLKGLTKKT